MVILAGDIGGTNARLGLFEPDGASLRKIITTRFPSREHASLEEIVEQFLAKVGGPVQRACFAVAGPVSEGRVAATNLAWVVDTGGLARVVGLETVLLINDLEAIARGYRGPGRRRRGSAPSGTRGPRREPGDHRRRHRPGRGRCLLGREPPPPVRMRGRARRLRAPDGHRDGAPELSAPQARSREF